jgi:hypothetical protein
MKTLRMIMALAIAMALPAAMLAQSAHSVTVSWTDALNPSGTTYDVYRASGSCAGTPVFVKMNAAPITALTYTDSGVAPGTYCYYVDAFLVGLVSAPSNNAPAAVPPFPPSAVSITVH